MGVADFDVYYDEEFDVLTIHHRSEKTKYSVELGDFAVDIGRRAPIVGITIHYASETLNTDKKLLSDLTCGSVVAVVRRNTVFVKYILTSKKRPEPEISEQIALSRFETGLSIPLAH